MFLTRIRYVTHISRELRHEFHIRFQPIRGARGTKNKVRRRVVSEGSRHHGGRRAIRICIITVITEKVGVSAKWMIRFTVSPSN